MQITRTNFYSTPQFKSNIDSTDKRKEAANRVERQGQQSRIIIDGIFDENEEILAQRRPETRPHTQMQITRPTRKPTNQPNIDSALVQKGEIRHTDDNPPTKHHTKISTRALRSMLFGIMLGATLATGANHTTTKLNEPKPVIVPYIDGVTDIEGLAKAYNVDPQSITYSNDYTSVAIPVGFDYLQEKINDKRAQVRKETETEKIYELYEEIGRLVDKQEKQQSIAMAYDTGDDYIRFRFLEPQEGFGVTVEEFKQIFDIDDGALSKCPENGITYDVTEGEFLNNAGRIIPPGTIFQVPKDDIDTKNINFNY